jgi:CheY-like chemotaxis protein
MDVKMPGEYDGLEATRRIRQIKADIPIIAQTAFAMDMDKTRAIESGCNDYISKPYNSVKLKSLIKKYLK